MNQDAIDAYHAHLDRCYQCANSPMTPCVVGGRLLRATAEPPARPPEIEVYEIKKPGKAKK